MVLRVFQFKEYIKTIHSEISHWETDTVKHKHHQLLLSVYFVPCTPPDASNSTQLLSCRIHSQEKVANIIIHPGLKQKSAQGCRLCQRLDDKLKLEE